MAPVAASPPGKDVALEALRGLAALVVVAWHSMLSFFPATSGIFEGLARTDAKTGMIWFGLINGKAAVAFFFVLSGFVLTRRYFVTGDSGIIVRGPFPAWLAVAVTFAASILVSVPLAIFGRYWLTPVNAFRAPHDRWYRLGFRLDQTRGSLKSNRGTSPIPNRTSDAAWHGTLREGHGHMRFGGGAYDGAFSWNSRFAEGGGTNPEELLAAAHAGCYSMALSGDLVKAGFKPVDIRTTAEVHLEQVTGAWTITLIELTCGAEVPGIDEATFQKIAAATRDGCPVSRALAAVKITLDATLKA